MYNKLTYLIVICFTFVCNVSGQNNKVVTPKPAKVACDCKSAIRINLNKPIVRYGPTIDTSGYGKIQEIPVKQKYSGYYFEEEHNSSWYTLNIGVDGNLVFDIKPKVFTDDYDFLLFKYTDTSFCTQFIKRNLIPERSNISRNVDTAGLTGLSIDVSNKYAIRGIGDNYSEYIPVKKGEKYVLVLDDVTEGGKGYTITFKILTDILFSGVVRDEENRPVKADVNVEDQNGLVGHGVSDEKTGQFSFHAQVVGGQPYTFDEYSDSTFFYSKQIVIVDTNKYKFQDILVFLPKLKAGKKYPVTNIHFEPGVDEMIRESYPTVQALYRLLKRNKKLVIRIEGHVNGPGQPNYASSQKLSEDRATAVLNYLVNRGISKDRLSIKGFGNQKMLYPKAVSDYEQEMNRRVEINVISIK